MSRRAAADHPPEPVPGHVRPYGMPATLCARCHQRLVRAHRRTYGATGPIDTPYWHHSRAARPTYGTPDRAPENPT